MKPEDLKKKIEDLEKAYPLYKGNNTAMFNLQYETNKLYLEIINDSNNKTEQYNNRLLIYTVVIAILTLAMTFLTLVMVLPSIKKFF